MTATCSAQTMNWWSDKCGDCGHMLAAHRDVDEISFGSCSICEMQASFDASIAAQNEALRSYADELNKQAQDFAQNLQDKAKTYIDAENTRFQDLAKGYVDGKAADLNAKIDANQTAAKAYIDQQDSKFQATAKAYVDQQIPLVITAKVLPAALK